MDRTIGNGPPTLVADDSTSAGDPFKARLQKDVRKRADKRDPRIQAPRSPELAAAAAPAAMDIVGRHALPPVRAASASQPEQIQPGPIQPAPRMQAPPKQAPPKPEPRKAAAAQSAAPKSTAKASAFAFPWSRSRQKPSGEPIIPPGEVFADPTLTEMVEQRDGAFVPVKHRGAHRVEGLSPVIAPATTASLAARHVSSTAPTPARTSARAFAADIRAPAALKPVTAAAVATQVPSDRQDDVATGALAALVLLLAGWMGFNLLGSPVRPAPLAEADPGPIVRTASAPAPAPVAAPAPAADPFAGAPVDLTPASPTVAIAGTVSTSAIAAQSMPMSPAVFASFSVSSALMAAAAAPAAATEVPPALPVSCDPNLVMRTYFCTAQSNLSVSARAMLERELANLQACANGREIIVTGYADTRGLATRNATLSESRAETVANMLRSRGLAVVTVAGAGEAAGLEDNRNCAQQRRVDISFKDGAPPAALSCALPASAAAMSCG